MGPSLAPMGSQRGSQNHEISTLEGVSKQGRSPGEGPGVPRPPHTHEAQILSRVDKIKEITDFANSKEALCF